MQRLLLLLASALLLWAVLAADTPEARARWWKGNTHTHTLWSDGQAAPEVPTDWYSSNGYHFLVLSDHNVMQQGERWFPVSEDGSRRLKPAELDGLLERFPEEVELRDGAKGREMRLATLVELKERFERAGEFLLVPGEEVTASWRDEAGASYAVHINAVGLRDRVPPRGGDSVADLMNDALDAIAAHGEEHDVPVLAHINHPNMGWGISWEDLAQMRADRFFEIYNGHRSVRNQGDATHPGTEEMWDRANARRVSDLDLPLLYGVATDDAHDYYGGTTSVTGRGWVQVLATELSEAVLIGAMKAGDFYSSSGVTLERVDRGTKRYLVDIEPEEGVTYTTSFVGVLEGSEEPVVLAETAEDPAVYEFTGEELFVRAVVTSSKDHPDPYATGDKEMAWTQPSAPGR